MSNAKLTNRYVEALKPSAKDFTAWDNELPGFGVRVTPKGAKSWVVMYRPFGGGRGAPTRRLTLGKVSVLRAEAARREARGVLARVRLGSDPAKELADQRNASTVKQIADDYMQREIEPKKAKNTTTLYAGYLRLHILPALGSKRASDVTHADIDRLHRKIGADAKPTANRVVVFLTALYNWAAGDQVGKRNPYGLAKGFNPATGIKKYAEEGRERFLTGDDLARLGMAIREAETIGIPYTVDLSKPTAKHARKKENRRTRISPHAAAALRLLLFTGARLREILHLRWEHIDFDRGVLFLPKSKTGKKTIVLNAPAIAILSSLPRIGAFVIAGQSAGVAQAEDETPRTDLQRPWRAIQSRAGLAGVRLHDLRHSFASIGVGGGMGLPIIGKLLGHRHTATTEKYAHLDTDPLRLATDQIGATIAAAMGDTEHSNVVPLKRAVS